MIITGVCFTTEFLLVLITLFLWLRDSSIKKANRFLGLFFLLLGMLNLSLFILYLAWIRNIYFFIFCYFPLEHLVVMFLGPVLYFYLLLLFNPACGVTPRQMIVHALPALPALAYVLYYTTLPLRVRIGLLANVGGVQSWMDRILNAIFFIQSLSYLRFCFLKVNTLRATDYNLQTKAYEYNLGWLREFLLLVMAVIFVYMLIGLVINTIYVVIYLGTCMIAVPVLYFFIRSLLITGLSMQDVIRFPEQIGRGLKLDNDLVADYSLRLEDTMENKKPYLRQDCSLKTIADLTNISTHHLSNLLNVHLGKNFNDFINEYRCRHAFLLLGDIASHRLTVEAIGIQSGFSSRGNFHSAFKKVYGNTPSGYLTDRS